MIKGDRRRESGWVRSVSVGYEGATGEGGLSTDRQLKPVWPDQIAIRVAKVGWVTHRKRLLCSTRIRKRCRVLESDDDLLEGFRGEGIGVAKLEECGFQGGCWAATG